MVPVYNVERYIAACLDSILAQPISDYEVVIVDDGATDRSADIAVGYVDRHAHLRMIRQANAGLGAARNVGIAAARGELLTFVDSDDELPRDAYSKMLTTLERSGSDFVVGMLKRDDGKRRTAMPRMRENHRVERIGVDVHEYPGMLADVFAVNKIFRRSFWDSADLSFPEGTRYEDQPTLTKAFLLARGFDVIRETVYLWRIRDDGSSITQRRDDIADLTDRIVTKRDSTALVRRYGQDLERRWLADVLTADMGAYFRSVPGCSDEYWTALRNMVREFWTADTVPYEATVAPAHQRLMGWLVTHDRREEVVTVARFLDDRAGDPPPTELRGGRVVRLLPGLDDPAVRQDLFELSAEETRWEARALSTAWDSDTLTMKGFALIRNVPTAGRLTELAIHLVNVHGSTEAVTLEVVDEPRATRYAGQATGNFDGCGFVAAVDLTRLVPASSGTTSWRFVARRTVEQMVRQGGVNSWDPSVVVDRCHDFAEGVSALLRDNEGELELVIRKS